MSRRPFRASGSSPSLTAMLSLAIVLTAARIESGENAGSSSDASAAVRSARLPRRRAPSLSAARLSALNVERANVVVTTTNTPPLTTHSPISMTVTASDYARGTRNLAPSRVR
ncbi:MAG: hypothetical protein ACXVVQ_20480 [Solirubrobacteraceae bacterium]